MFEDMLPCYDDLSVWALLIFIKNRRPIRALIDNGRRKTGSLRGIKSGQLEEIVGVEMMERFCEAQRILADPVPKWISDMWIEDLNSRRGRIVLKRSQGLKYADIAEEEGLSRQRITQMVCKFFAGQEAFLNIVADELSDNEDKRKPDADWVSPIKLKTCKTEMAVT